MFVRDPLLWLTVKADARPFRFLLIDMHLCPALEAGNDFASWLRAQVSFSAFTKCSGAETCVGCGAGDELDAKVLTGVWLGGVSVLGESFFPTAQTTTKKTSSGSNND